jgi:manganese transport protein
MEGFVDVRLSPTLRRTVTMLPALAVLAIGTSPTTALVASQVVLSFGVPFALYALLRVARDERVLGAEAIGKPMSLLLATISAVVICLNVVLLVDTFTG